MSTIFLRPEKDGSHRMILTLTYLNKSAEKIHFKMVMLKTAMALLVKDCFFASLDVRDACYSISIDRDFKELFRFKFCDSFLYFSVFLRFQRCT